MMTNDNTADKQEQSGEILEARRQFLKQSSAITAIALVAQALVDAAEKKLDEKAADVFKKVPLYKTEDLKGYIRLL
jgi:xanthine dehydrogenase YagT iron-sulfur-binding subunit